MEGRRIFAPLTVEENLLLAARDVSKEERDDRLDRIYSLFPELKERRLNGGTSMSGGQQQMLAIGRALMSKPKLVLFDEISLGLAPVMMDRLYLALAELKAAGLTMLIVEQDVERALELADDVHVMEHERHSSAHEAVGRIGAMSMKLSEKLIPLFSEQEQSALAPQQINLLNNAVKRIIEGEGEVALTQPRLEGVKELVLEHLWPIGLATVDKVRTSMKGFYCLSSHWNFFTAKVNDPVIDQVLNGVEGWTALAKTFPVVIGVRTKNRLFLLFRNSEEESSTTESTALAMVSAYDADELFLCSATDVLGGLKAFLVTRTKTTEGVGIFFELTESGDRWVIGDPVGKIDPNTLGDFMGAVAFKSFNSDSASARREEARQALIRWQPMYDWQFDAVVT